MSNFTSANFVILILIALLGCALEACRNSNVKNEDSNPIFAKVGEILHTDYFDIMVNSAKFNDRVTTGNEFSDLQPEAGYVYLILNVTYKNTDTQSHMIMPPSIWLNYNDKDYEFDVTEMVMLDGWGLFLDQLNPLSAKTTNLVYKIPLGLNGLMFWQPIHDDFDHEFILGKL